MGGISLVISEPGLKERVSMGGRRGRGSAPVGGCIVTVTQSNTHRWHGRTQCISGMGGGKSPDPGQVRSRRDPLRRVKPLPCHPESRWCCCSRPPCLPKPAAPQHPQVPLSPPATAGEHGRGGTCHRSTAPSRSPAPGSQLLQTQVLSKGLMSSSALCHHP